MKGKGEKKPSMKQKKKNDYRKGSHKKEWGPRGRGRLGENQSPVNNENTTFFG